MATSLANCFLTIMGIKSRSEKMTPIDGAIAEVTKVMYNEPRRIGEIHVKIIFPKNNFTEQKSQLKGQPLDVITVVTVWPDLFE